MILSVVFFLILAIMPTLGTLPIKILSFYRQKISFSRLLDHFKDGYGILYRWNKEWQYK